MRKYLMKSMWDVRVKRGRSRTTDDSAMKRSGNRVVFQRERALEGQREEWLRQWKWMAVVLVQRTTWKTNRCPTTIGNHKRLGHFSWSELVKTLISLLCKRRKRDHVMWRRVAPALFSGKIVHLRLAEWVSQWQTVRCGNPGRKLGKACQCHSLSAAQSNWYVFVCVGEWRRVGEMRREWSSLHCFVKYEKKPALDPKSNPCQCPPSTSVSFLLADVTLIVRMHREFSWI